MGLTRGPHEVRGIDHVGLTVPDLGAAVAFFVDVLGAAHVFTHGPYDGSPQTPARFGRPAESRVAGIAMLRLGETNLELLEISSPCSRSEPPRPDDGGGHHLAIYVDHLEGAAGALRSAGVEVLDGPMPLPGPESGPDAQFIFFRSPWGTLLELVSYPSGKDYEAGTDRRLHDPRKLPPER